MKRIKLSILQMALITRLFGMEATALTIADKKAAPYVLKTQFSVLNVYVRIAKRIFGLIKIHIYVMLDLHMFNYYINFNI